MICLSDVYEQVLVVLKEQRSHILFIKKFAIEGIKNILFDIIKTQKIKNYLFYSVLKCIFPFKEFMLVKYIRSAKGNLNKWKIKFPNGKKVSKPTLPISEK